MLHHYSLRAVRNAYIYILVLMLVMTARIISNQYDNILYTHKKMKHSISIKGLFEILPMLTEDFLICISVLIGLIPESLGLAFTSCVVSYS